MGNPKKQNTENEIIISLPIEPEKGMPYGTPGISLVLIGGQWYYRETSMVEEATDIPIPKNVFEEADWDYTGNNYFPRKLGKALRGTNAFFHGVLSRSDIVDIEKLDRIIRSFRKKKIENNQ